MSSKKIKDEFNFVPKWNLEDSIRDMYNYEQNKD